MPETFGAHGQNHRTPDLPLAGLIKSSWIPNLPDTAAVRCVLFLFSRAKTHMAPRTREEKEERERRKSAKLRKEKEVAARGSLWLGSFWAAPLAEASLEG